MIEGISKERLIEIKQSLPHGQARLNLERLIAAECTELDPWIPIDENTPKDKPVLLLLDRGFAVEGYWDACCWKSYIYNEDECSWRVTPTHYKLLPEDPKPHKPEVSE